MPLQLLRGKQDAWKLFVCLYWVCSHLLTLGCLFEWQFWKGCCIGHGRILRNDDCSNAIRWISHRSTFVTLADWHVSLHIARKQTLQIDRIACRVCTFILVSPWTWASTKCNNVLIPHQNEPALSSNIYFREPLENHGRDPKKININALIRQNLTSQLKTRVLILGCNWEFDRH